MGICACAADMQKYEPAIARMLEIQIQVFELV